MTNPTPVQSARIKLAELSRLLGEPAEDLAILGEGNTSTRIDEASFLIKASGSSLRQATEATFVQLSTPAVLAIIDSDLADDDQAGLGAALAGAAVHASELRPSIEATLHALAITELGAHYVAHSHPTAVNQILCSDRAEALVAGALFPDQIVVLGPHPLLIPYAEPGLPLARVVRTAMREHVDAFGRPKIVYLQNHGIVALADTATEILQISQMAVKAARILAGALSVGAPQYLSAASAAQLDARPDEIYRRRVLAGNTIGERK